MQLKLLTIIAASLAWAAQVTVDPLPKPASIQWGDSGAKTVSGGLWLDTAGQEYNSVVRDAFNRMQNNVRELKWTPAAVPKPFPSDWFEPIPTYTAAKKQKRDNGGSPALQQVKLKINDPDADLQMGVDESYTLEIAQDSQDIVISAETTWGALHAFTTLQQIIIANDKNGGFIVEQPVKIEDKPNYPHRGVMIDTARNFQSKKATLRQLDAMALSKLNVMHWHITDTQSWPVEIKSYPEMTKDAYSPRNVHSEQDMKDVIEYARARGVRVVPEVDLPGHSSSGYAQLPEGDEILACQKSFWSNDDFAMHTSVEPNPGQLDIMQDKTYEVVGNIYNDLSNVFPDHVFHVGMDELATNCYNYSQKSMDFIHDGHTWNELAQKWIDRAVPMFKKGRANRRLMMWEDAVTSADIAATDVPKDIIMQAWNGLDNVKTLVSKGYDVVLSNNPWFYLDCGFGSWALNDPRVNEMVDPAPGQMTFNFGGTGGSWCGPYKNWQRIYDYDIGFNLTDAEKAHILGIETPLWAEMVDDTVIDAKMWPRAAAMAELAWSGNRDKNGHKRTTEMSQRILNFREYLVASGVNASPLTPQYCLTHPHHCDLYRNQTVNDDYFDNSPDTSS